MSSFPLIQAIPFRMDLSLACFDIVIPVDYWPLADKASFCCCLPVLLIAVAFSVDNQLRATIIDFKELRKHGPAANCAARGMALAVAGVAVLF